MNMFQKLGIEPVTNDKDSEKFGEIAYNAYCVAAYPPNITPRAFGDLRREDQLIWCITANAVAKELIEHVSESVLRSIGQPIAKMGGKEV